MKIKTYKAAS